MFRKLAFIPAIRAWVVLVFLILMSNSLYGGEYLTRASFSTSSSFVSGDNVPYWMWANRYGLVSSDEGSAYAAFRIEKEMPENRRGRRTLGWYYGLDAAWRYDGSGKLMLTDAYAGLTYRNFHLTVGRRAEFFGLADTLLSAGSPVYSRNAPPIPKVSLATNGYVDIIKDVLACNVYMAHGWMGDERYVEDAWLHQKFVYLRFGGKKKREGVNFYVGLHHLALWGGTDRVTGRKQPSGFEDFLDVFLGKKGGEGATVSDQQNALGDHFGSVDYAVRFKGRARDWLFYASTLFEDRSGVAFPVKLFRWYDYSAGVSMISKRRRENLKRINLEVIDTRDHGAKGWEPDNYFDHGFYRSGWVYEGYMVGHPFVRFKEGANYDYTPDNRVRGVSLSALFGFGNIVNPMFRIACVKNYGNVVAPFADDDQIVLYAFDVTNTTYLTDRWILSQQFSLDTGENTETTFGFGLGVTGILY